MIKTYNGCSMYNSLMAKVKKGEGKTGKTSRLLAKTEKENQKVEK